MERVAPSQRRATPHVPATVVAASRSPADRLPEPMVSSMSARFGYDFSRVRVHADGSAARSAAEIGARAWTLGSDVVFGAGMYAPTTRPGLALLTHELAHVVQQRDVDTTAGEPLLGEAADAHEREADASVRAVAEHGEVPRLGRVPGPRVQGSFLSGLLDVLLFIPRLFGLETFPAEQLREYLSGLRARRGPELGLFSDNKARACVSRERELGPYDVQTKIWLIDDMLDGWTSFLDEGAIITLLRGSGADRDRIAQGVGRDRLWSKFSGQNRRIVEAQTLTAADAGEGLISRLRTLEPGAIDDYAANATDPAVRESARRAAALSGMTAPAPSSAVITPAGEAKFAINGVRITFGQDRVIPALGDHAQTHADFQAFPPGLIPITPENANTPVAGVSPPDMTLEIWTEYGSAEAKKKPPGYGVGTRAHDDPTLHAHERAHSEAWLTFLRNNRPPTFAGADGMLPAQYNAAVAAWRSTMADYSRRAQDFALRAGDCVGTLPTDQQLEGTGFTAAICHQP